MDSIEYGPVYQTGMLTIEDPDVLEGDLQDVEFGVQVANDGRVWVCVNGIALLRFKPIARKE